MANGEANPAEGPEYVIVIRHNVVTKQLTIEGLGSNFVVALGMLEYALMRVRRLDAQVEMAAQMANAPRVLVPRGPLS